MRLADQIRTYVIENLITPARAAGDTTITIQAATIHAALALADRMPAVCGALDAAKFAEAAGVTLRQRTGPPQGANAEWRFALH